MPPPTSIGRNPFCAARLRPGTIDFVFEQGKSLEQLVDALEANAWQGQITGRPRHRQVDPAGRLDAGHRRPRPAGQIDHPRGRAATSATAIPAILAAERRLGSGRGRRRRTTPYLEPPAPQAILPDTWRRPHRGVASFGRCPASTKRPSTRPGPGASSSGFKTAFRRKSRSATSSSGWPGMRAICARACPPTNT